MAGEPLCGPGAYGEDRFFVFLRLEDDDNSALDRWLEGLLAAGQPAVVLSQHDRYDLGGEFFRWEVAVAVAGAILGVNPFDQPDVQGAKDATERVLKRYENLGGLPSPAVSGSLEGLLEQAQPGDYLAIMAYLRQTPEVEDAFQALRRRVMERRRIATTLGYGPRFLHSTGQLHKGGPNTGLFLQITCADEEDCPVPGEEYTFGRLADAQALGDLRTLQQRGRRVARVRLASDYLSAAIRRLAEGVT